MDVLVAPLGESEFAAGVRTALIALLALAAAFGTGAIVAGRRPRPVPAGGIALAGAFLVAVQKASAVPGTLIIGVVLAGGAGLLMDQFDIRGVPLMLATMPAAAVVSAAADLDGTGTDTLRLSVFAGVCVGGPLVASFDQRFAKAAWGPALLAVTAGGIYSAVPDTEHALVLLGTTVVIAAAGWPMRIARLGGAGALAATAVVAWTVGVGGRGREGSIVGALGCLGLLVIDPLVRTAGGRSPLRFFTRNSATAVVVCVQAMIVFWMARVAGLQEHGLSALALMALGGVLAGVGWAGAGRRGHLEPRPDRS